MKLLLAITLLFGCQFISAKYIPGKCPDFQTVSEFDLNKYLGRWYEMNRITYREEIGDQCSTIDFGYVSATKVSIKNSWVDENGLHNNDAAAELTGVEPGQFLYEKDGAVSDYYNVLAVDYDRYSSAYACRQHGDMINEFGWIFFRTNVRNQTLFDEALEAFTKIGVDASAFDFTYQGSECLYTDYP